MLRNKKVMRTPRKYVLPPGSIFHFMWRCINGEMMLANERVKRKYISCRIRFMIRARGKVLLHSFCIMDNHIHESASLLAGSEHMSNWARSAHSSFGRWLNNKLGRRGPVAQDRPHTVAVEDQESLKRVMFYGDWNPVRAGLCKHPREWAFSSYRFYAYGEESLQTAALSPPKWYADLATTPEERQAQYRRLCDEYHDTKRLPDKSEAETGHAFGCPAFMARRHAILHEAFTRLRLGLMPRKALDHWVQDKLAGESTSASFTPSGPSENRAPP